MSTGSSCDYCWCLSFFGFLESDLSPWRYRNRCFLVALCHLIIRRQNLEVATKGASPSVGKNTGIVLVPCSCMKVHPYSYFRWCGYFWGPWMSFVTTHEFSVRVKKITSRIGVSWTHGLPIFNLFKLNELRPYYQKHVDR